MQFYFILITRFKFVMKMMSYFKKHFVTRVRNFVFTYRKSIERKCHMTVNTVHFLYIYIKLRLIYTLPRKIAKGCNYMRYISVPLIQYKAAEIKVINILYRNQNSIVQEVNHCETLTSGGGWLYDDVDFPCWRLITKIVTKHCLQVFVQCHLQ